MRWIRQLRLRVGSLLRSTQVERELNDEFQYHLEHLVDDYVSGLALVDTLRQDITYAARRLRRAVDFTAPALLTLAVGIGATTSMFSVVNGVLIRPLPYHDPERLVMLWTDDVSHNIHEEGVSYVNFEDWRTRGRSFEDMAICSRQIFATITDGPEPEEVQPAVVSANLFSVLGVRPLLGRTFSPQEVEDGERVVILSHGFWQRRFGGSPNALGQSVEISGTPWRVIGVMPASFQFPTAEIALWQQLTAFRAWPGLQHERYTDWGRVVGRLKPAVTVAHAQAEMSAIGDSLALAYPPVGPEAADFAGFNVRVLSAAIRESRTDGATLESTHASSEIASAKTTTPTSICTSFSRGRLDGPRAVSAFRVSAAIPMPSAPAKTARSRLSLIN